MTKLPDWLHFENALGQIAELEDWLGPLAQTAEKWGDLAGKLKAIYDDAPQGDPVAVIEFALGKIGDPAVKTLFGELDLAEEHEKLEGLKDKVEKSKWAPLLKPTDTFIEAEAGGDQGLIDLSLVKGDLSDNAEPGKGKLSFGLGGAAGLQVETGARWPLGKKEQTKGLLRIGAKGNFKAGASGWVPFPLLVDGKISAEAKASGEASLDYFFSPGAAAIYGSALLPALREMPDPLDLLQLEKAKGFEGLLLKIKGAGSAGLSVSLGKDLQVPSWIDGRADLGAALSFLRETDWQLSLRREGAGFHYTLSRTKESKKDWEVGLNLALDISGLTQRLHYAVLEVSELSGEVLADIKPFLSPGTYVQTKLSGKLTEFVEALGADDAFKQALLADASILLGGDAAGGLKVEDWAKDQVGTALDKVKDGVFAEAKDLKKSILAEFAAKLPEFVPEEAGTKVTEKADELIALLDAEFEEKVRGKLKASTSHTKKLSKELKKIGLTVEGAQDDADDALEGVRQLIGQYQGFIEDVLEATKDAEKAKLEAKIALSGGSGSGSEQEVSGTITQFTPETARLWRSLAMGKMEPFQRILGGQAKAPDGFGVDEGSSISRFASSYKGFAASITVFDARISFEAIAKGEAKVLSYGGRVVVSAEAKFEARKKFLKVAREANFISVYDLKTAKEAEGTEEAERSIGLSLDLTRSDESLDRDELWNFLVALSERLLVSEDRLRDAEAIRRKWLDEGKKKTAGEVAIRYAMSPIALKRMMVLGSECGKKPDTRFALYKLAVSALIEAGFGDSYDTKNGFKAMLRRAKSYTDKYEALYDGKAGELVVSGPRMNWSSAKRNQNDLYETMIALDLHGQELCNLFAIMAQVYEAVPVGVAGDGWSEEKYRKAEQDIADAARKWLLLKEFFKTRLNASFVTFLRILISLERQIGTSATTGKEVLALMKPEPSNAEGDKFIDIKMKVGAMKEAQSV